MEIINAKSIFSPATGFIRRGGFDWTCNPYLGCTFGCTYCYAQFLPQNPRSKEDWGKWLQAKANAVELAQKQAHRFKGQAGFIASVTDPYLPIERSLCLTRGILEALVPFQPRIVIQTRGPLVVRDIDVLSQFEAVRVNMSIPTDSEAVRQKFEPKAPPLDRRWEALAAMKASGLPIGICVTPMLPLEDPEGFARRLANFGADVVVAQDFHDSKGGFGADTGNPARQLLAGHGWTPDDYRRCFQILSSHMHVYEGEAGFFPPEPRRLAKVTEVSGPADPLPDETSKPVDDQAKTKLRGGTSMRTSPKRPENAVSVTTYAKLDEYLHGFVAGHFSLLIIIGGPGLQKSRNVRRAVGTAVCWIDGNTTPFGMYMKLAEHVDLPVVIDDVDSVHAQPSGVRLLKCLCQTEPRKTVSWNSYAMVSGSINLPREFTTSSCVTIIANDWKTLNVNVAAVEDRGHVLFFEPPPLEVHVRTAEWFSDQEIFDFIGERLHLIGKPSMRHYTRARELKAAGMDWRKALLSQWLSGPALLVAQLVSDPTYASEEKRVEAFIAQGGGCKATYFNHKKKLHPPVEEPPRIILKSEPPAGPVVGLDLLDVLQKRYGELGKG